MSSAGAMRSSIRSSSPAAAQASRASAVYSSLTSQHSKRPPGASPRAMQIDEYPVNVPTSTAFVAPTRRVSSVSSAPSSPDTCIAAMRPSSAVRRWRSRSTSSAPAAWAPM